MDGIAEEQAFSDSCYRRLDAHVTHLTARMAEIAHSPGTGTGQDLLERQALYDNLSQQVTAARAAANRLCFGRVDMLDGGTHRIGRIGLRDDDGEPLLLDWRAPNAAGFYQATSVEPMGVSMRRRIISRDRTVTHIEDEDLANPTNIRTDGTPADANNSGAAASAVDVPREGRMGDIISTIAADQDRIVRSAMNQVTVVEGGPGTGKTVVALHRAAWLLYTYRDRLARDGVLVVGPSTTFLRYIDQVLPSLGETDVVLLTPGQLYPGISTDIPDERDVAALKGDLAMVRVIANAVRQQVRLPASDVTIRLQGGGDVRVSAAQLADARRSTGGTYHAGREPFLRRVLDLLARDRARRHGEDPGDAEVRQHHLVDLVEDADVRRTLNLMWLPTTPERLIHRLLTRPDVLSAAAHGILPEHRQRLLIRDPGEPWTIDDVPLLDEAAERLGPWEPPERARVPQSDPEYAELRLTDPFARRHLTTTVAERAVSDRSWIYGHVVVDEAQELSRMAWHALSRRCSRKSMTIVGDLQQTTHPAGARDWDQALGWAKERIDLHTLTVTYRITRETASTATELLTHAGGRAPDLRPIRSGPTTERLSCRTAELPALLKARAAEVAGRIGVVVPDRRGAELTAMLRAAGDEFGIGDDALDSTVAVLTARDTKGLEFDHVYVIDPELIAYQGRAGSDIYVACTRATQTLHLISTAEGRGPTTR